MQAVSEPVCLVSLATGQVIENARGKGEARLPTICIQTGFGCEAIVDVSVTHLPELARPDRFFVMRQSRDERSDRSAPNLGDKDASNVAELVRASTLKEVVSETAEAVEKICIETATELTNNNRITPA